MLRIVPLRDRIPVSAVRTNLLRIRDKLQLTQGDVALRLHVSRKTIERIEQSAVDTVDRELANKIAALEKPV